MVGEGENNKCQNLLLMRWGGSKGGGQGTHKANARSQWRFRQNLCIHFIFIGVEFYLGIRERQARVLSTFNLKPL